MTQWPDRAFDRWLCCSPLFRHARNSARSRACSIGAIKSFAEVSPPTGAAISIENIPAPQSYNLTEETAGAAPPSIGAPSAASERVIGGFPAEGCWAMFSEGAAAEETSALGVAKEIAAGLFRSTGAGIAC